MKKILSTLLVIAMLLVTFTGCSNNKEENLTYTPTEVIAKIYEGFGEEELPILMDVELTSDSLEYYLGLTSLDFKEGMVSEPMMTSVAHSVVVVRVNEGVDVEQTKADIKANVNPAKWLCVEAEEVVVESKGDMIILVMSNKDTATKIIENFKNIK